MALWLCKQEPETYSYDDLARDGKTTWDGVANPLARKHLWAMQVGDRVLYYHTGKEKAIVGEMVVASAPTKDPKSDDTKAVVVDMKPVRKFATIVTLAQIKKDARLAQWDLVRLPRLSVIPVTDEQWHRVFELMDETDIAEQA
jgi:predicted RNA-binding protein with PUA-like domain